MKTLADTFCKIATGRRGDGATGRRGEICFPEPLCRPVAWSPHRPVALFLFLSVFLAACGKVGPPLPPERREKLHVENLSVEQQGAHLILSLPFTRTPKTQLQRIDVYRLVEPLDAPLGLPIEIYSEKASVVYSILADDIPLDRSGVIYYDVLNVKGEAQNKRYRYSVRMITTAGQAADFSTYATIEPLLNLALPPAGLAAKQAETQIEITWDPPEGNMNETSPANVAGYNIYRRQGGSFIKVNVDPLLEPRFVDRNFQFGAKYQYVVRSLSFKPGSASLSESIESDDSPPLDHTPKDTFPPAPPKPLTIASINSMVSVFWPLSAEPDVVGYNVYRAEDEKAPPEKWVKLNPELHKSASFRDDSVQVGKKYFYQITAVDAFGNEGARSETVSETVAP
jgi:fibronectin type 3 domain-containing protein